MNLDHLEIFIDLAETLNFRKTAYRKNISQPAVSQAISSIENEIGVHLFKRSRSGVELLAKGKILYENIKPLINTYYKSIQEVRQSNGEDTLITIGLTNSPYEQNFLPELLPKFQSAHPQTKIFLQNYDHLQLKRQLINGDCDLILTTKDDITDIKNVEFNEVITGRFFAEIPKKNILSKRKVLSSSDLNRQSVILLDNNWCPPEQLRLQEIIRKGNLSNQISYVNNVNTANIMSESGLGITIGPDFIFGTKNKYVSSVPFDYDVKLAYGAAHLKDNKKSIVKEFTSFLNYTLNN